MKSKLLASILCFFAITLVAQTANVGLAASGYVTSVFPDGSFNVEGWPVRLDPHAVFLVHQRAGTEIPVPTFKPFVGQFVDVFGVRTKDKSVPRSILAVRIAEIEPDLSAIQGTAIIDLIPQSTAVGTDRIVRADGRFLRIPATAKLELEDSLTSQTALATNVWIRYEGTLQSDGSILIDVASLRRNTVKGYEDKLHKKTEYDPAAVSQDAKQSGVSKFFYLIDLKKVHPHPDETLQARITRIGESLVPAYQRSLPVDDPTRLNFRFQIVDLEAYREPLALPSGIVLIPFSGVDRLKSDSQIAATLAIAIAFTFEKEQVRGRSAKNLLSGAQAAGYLASPVGILGSLAAGMTQEHLDDLKIQQAGRVALCLMHDAGYDIGQAPIAIWLSDPEDPKPLEKTKMPKRAADLYRSLGTTWSPGSFASTI